MSMGKNRTAEERATTFRRREEKRRDEAASKRADAVAKQIQRITPVYRALNRHSSAAIIAIGEADPSYFQSGLRLMAGEENVLQMPAKGITQGNALPKSETVRHTITEHIDTVSKRQSETPNGSRSQKGILLLHGHDFTGEKGGGNAELQNYLSELVATHTLSLVIVGYGSRNDLPTSPHYDRSVNRGIAGEVAMTYGMTTENTFETILPAEAPAYKLQSGVRSLSSATLGPVAPHSGPIVVPAGNIRF